ncbi:unnamed protein product, partial [Hapterophycus canaliculatus]
GGIAERPGNLADIFHTFFGVAGLSLLGYFDGRSVSEGRGNGFAYFVPADEQSLLDVERDINSWRT